MQLQRGADGAQLVVVVGRRHAEQRDDFLADGLVHQSAVAPHDIDSEVAYLCDQAHAHRRRQLLDEAAVVRHDRHEHCRAATLGDGARHPTNAAMRGVAIATRRATVAAAAASAVRSAAKAAIDG